MKLGLQQPKPQDLSWLPPVPMVRRPQRGCTGHPMTESQRGKVPETRPVPGLLGRVCAWAWAGLMGTLRVLGPGQQPPSPIPELVAPGDGHYGNKGGVCGGRVERRGVSPAWAPPDQFPLLGTAHHTFQR